MVHEWAKSVVLSTFRPVRLALAKDLYLPDCPIQFATFSHAEANPAGSDGEVIIMLLNQGIVQSTRPDLAISTPFLEIFPPYFQIARTNGDFLVSPYEK